MNKANFCEACNMIRNGAKTRIALEHTCGLERGAIPDFDHGQWNRESNITIGGTLYEKYKELKNKKP
jgi:hypothetical protein